VERTGGVIDWRPILLGGVLKALHSDPGAGTAARQAMTRIDVQRWADHLGVPLRFPAEHPRRTVDAMRLLCWAPAVARPALAEALYRAYWVQGRDLASEEVLAEIAGSVGLDPALAVKGLLAPAARQELVQRTDAALQQGVFGVPTFIVESQGGHKLFFGQDRLHFVEAALLLHPLAGPKPTRDPYRRPAPATPASEVSETSPVANEARTITFFYDFSSPFSYLASTQIEAVAARHGAIIQWHPMLLGGLFRAQGTPLVPIHTYSEAKRKHIRDDLNRWAHYYDQPFHWPSRFPMMTVTALRLALLAGDRIAALSQALFRAYWVDDGDLNDPVVLQEALSRCGLDSGLLDQVGSPEIRQKLVDNTESAQKQGIFGAPSFLVQQHHGPPSLFFGQDRLLFVEKALQRGTADDSSRKGLSATD
jgi:2-hydroxychromene-2-carboxylate isomerase